MHLTRRNAVIRMAVLMEAPASGQSTLLDEIASTIIPPTAVPGRFDGNLPYAKLGRAWAGVIT